MLTIRIRFNQNLFLNVRLELPEGVCLNSVTLIHSDCGGGEGPGLEKNIISWKIKNTREKYTTNLLEWS